MKSTKLALLLSLTVNSYSTYGMNCDNFYEAYKEHLDNFALQPENIVNHLQESYTLYKANPNKADFEQILNRTKTWLDGQGVSYKIEEIALTNFKISGNEMSKEFEEYLVANYGDLKNAEHKVKVISISSEGNSKLNKIAQKMKNDFGGEKFYITPFFKPWESQLKNVEAQGWFTFGEGTVIDFNKLNGEFNEASMKKILQEANLSRLEQFGYIPKIEETELFNTYLNTVKKHFLVNDVVFEAQGVGKDMIFAFGTDPEGAKLNQLACSIYDKFNGSHLLYAPGINKERGAYGMYSPAKNWVFISHGTIIQLRPDRTGVHELMHAFFDQVKREQGINSLFHGKIHAVEGKEISARKSGYKTYMSLEEVTTHGMNVHIESKRLYELHKQGVYRTGLIKFISERATTGREIALQGKDVMQEILPLVNQAVITNIDNGVQFKFTMENYSVDFPFYYKDVVYTDAQLRDLLREMIQTRINVYGEVATNMDNVVVYAKTLVDKVEAGGKLKKDEIAQMVHLGTRPRAYLMKNK